MDTALRSEEMIILERMTIPQHYELNASFKDELSGMLGLVAEEPRDFVQQRM